MVSSIISLAPHEYSEEHPGSAEPSAGPADDQCPPFAHEFRGVGRVTGLLPKPEPFTLLEMQTGHRRARTSGPQLDFATKLADPDGEIGRVDSVENRSADPKPPSLGKRVARGVALLMMIFCAGVAATLVWQSYGQGIMEIASSYLQLGWLPPKHVTRVGPLFDSGIPTVTLTVSPDLITAAGAASSSPDLVAPTAPAGPSPDSEHLRTMSDDLAAMRELAAQLVATQQSMASEVAKLQAGQQEIFEKISSTPPPQPSAAPARKPVPTAAQPKGQTAPDGALTARSSRSSARFSFP